MALHSIQNYESNGVKGLYTDAIYELPFSVVTEVTFKPLSNYATWRQVAILSKWSIANPQLRADFPNIELVEFPTWSRYWMLLKMVNISRGTFDAKPVLSFSLDTVSFSMQPLKWMKRSRTWKRAIQISFTLCCRININSCYQSSTKP